MPFFTPFLIVFKYRSNTNSAKMHDVDAYQKQAKKGEGGQIPRVRESAAAGLVLPAGKETCVPMPATPARSAGLPEV
ncbi:hypothetical protein [Janthinobacterium sp. RT4P48]|uniref:hypothetical protein n=1 Tax=Janthinobacterium sp. RT4P48 TaxID=3424188 RepID=UPI003F270413